MKEIHRPRPATLETRLVWLRRIWQPNGMHHIPRHSSGETSTQRCGSGLWFVLGGVVAVVLLGATVYGAVRWRVLSAAPQTIRRAEEALRQRDPARARETLRWLLWFHPNDPKALLFTGISLHADRRFRDAVDLLGRIPESSDDYELAGLALAAALTADGQLERSEALLNRLLARFPDSRTVHEHLVLLYLSEFRRRDAQQLLRKRRQRAPDDLSVLPDLLELEVKKLTPHERTATLESADRNHPRQPPVVLALACAYALKGQSPLARDRFQQALALRPDDVPTRLLAAEFYLDLGELDEARTLLSPEPTVESPDSDCPGWNDFYWLLRCRLEEQAGQPATAYEHLQRALALRPYDDTYRLRQATLLRQLGRSAEAAEAARRAAQLAEGRHRLFSLSEKLNRRQPDPAVCREVANQLDALGQPQLAADWRRLSEAAAQFAPSPEAMPGL